MKRTPRLSYTALSVTLLALALPLGFLSIAAVPTSALGESSELSNDPKPDERIQPLTAPAHAGSKLNSGYVQQFYDLHNGRGNH